VLIVDFTDPYEQTANYSTAQWRTAQFTVGAQDLSKFSFTPSGYLLISPERNGTEIYQEKELTLYVDDVKMLPLSTMAVETTKSDPSFSAFYDPQSDRICVRNLPENIRKVRLFDLMGRLLQEVMVSGDIVLLDGGKTLGAVYIVQAIQANGSGKSIKVLR
jgi:outer membrane lipoprotein-sorting protein